MLFNRFPAYFLLTNVIIVPLSSLIIITGCMVPLLYPVVFLSQLLGTILNHMTGLTEFLTEKAASLPGSTITSIGMTVTECILLTGIIAALCTVLINRQLRTVKILLVMTIMISAASTFREISLRRSNELIVYNSPGATVIGIRTGKILNLYTTERDITAEVLRHSSTLGLKIERLDYGNGTTFIKVAGRKILISGSIGKSELSSLSPDIVILAESRPLIKDCSDLQEYPEMVIISSEVTSGFSLPDDFSSLLNNQVYNIRKSGAFTMSL
jgi:competence protein ComEC